MSDTDRYTIVQPVRRGRNPHYDDEDLWGLLRLRPAWHQQAACRDLVHFWDTPSKRPEAGRNPACPCGCDPTHPH